MSALLGVRIITRLPFSPKPVACRGAGRRLGLSSNRGKMWKLGKDTGRLGETTMTCTRILCILSVAFFAPAGWAQTPEKAKPGDVMIEKYLAAETDKLSKK